MFDKILIANRGEIACRIIKTAKRLGILTVAVYSDADSHALHVKLADESYYIGKSPSTESYLRGEKIVDIAIASGAQAIHPGYGFLSENAEFAELCEQAGICFIGPGPEAIYAMGSKSAAKKIMAEAKVPLIPGYHGEQQDFTTFKKEAQKIGYPIILKASAGGGGKGMRVVDQEQDLENALTGAKREALSSFNDDKILLEKYLTKPRHVEIQIFGDKHQNYIYLFERDCSIQRRHQKIIEEAPAPGMDEGLRKKMGEAAIKAAKAIKYVGAGTIEFLLDELGEFYFMEMNTRLQVEHPVTELITGLDLVHWQLLVADNQPLPLSQKDLTINGHAIEVRIYAEDPDNEFLPTMGEIKLLSLPSEDEGLRIDSGVAQGSNITPYYDPMIAKLIVWDKTRQLAIRKLNQALANYHIIGITTNIEFLIRIISQSDFIVGDIATDFIEQHHEAIFIKNITIPNHYLACAVLYLDLLHKQENQHAASNNMDPYSPWYSTDCWRLNLTQQQTVEFIIDDEMIRIPYQVHNGLLQFSLDNVAYLITGNLNSSNELIVNFLDNGQLRMNVFRDDQTLYLFGNGFFYKAKIHDKTAAYNFQDETSGSLNAPMPGTVVALYAETGKSVQRGDRLIVIEAMKMEHTINAPNDGVIKAIHYQVGDMVDEGVELLSLEV